MKQFYQFTGIISGVIYGLIIRMLGEYFHDFYSIYSISFIWITPIMIGLFPILFSSTQLYKSKLKLFLYPILTVLLFMLTALIIQIEDLVCLLIIGWPFLLTAGIVGLVIGSVVKDKVDSKKMYSILLLPLILNPIEHAIPNKAETFKVESSIVVHLTPEELFPNLLEVPVISENEYEPGFYQTIGVPRPVKSEIKIDNGRIHRIGTFTEGLKLYEEITALDENRFVNFKIDLQKSQLRNKPTDQHLLKSSYFNFENISYTLIPVAENQTKIVLSCDYQINSKMNLYANYWAENIIKDFEIRLLNALKFKFESSEKTTLL